MAKESYQETAARLSAAMDVAAVGMWEWWPASARLAFDDRYYTMAGYSPGEFPATAAAWRDHVHPDDRDGIREALNRLFRGETDSASGQFRFKTKSGGWIWILGRGRVFKRDAAGRPLHIIGTHADVSDLHDAKAESIDLRHCFRSLAERAQAGIFVAQNGRIRYANPSMSQITGYAPEELDDHPVADIVHPKDQAMVIDRHFRRLQGETPPDFYAFRMIDRQGRERWVDINALSFEWQGDPTILCLIRDITHAKAMERQLHQAQKMQAIGTLAGGIAHDFNNILSAMMGFTEICLAEAPRSSRTAVRLRRVIEAGQRASALIGQILAFSRQEEQDQKPVNLANVLKEALKLIRASVPATVRIDTRIDADAGSVTADPTRIHQVILNLCANAAHAMQDKGGVLTVALSRIDPDAVASTDGIEGLAPGAYVRLTVADTGCGMDRETIRHIFDPYYTTKKRGEGTGLGLSIVHGIVTQLGGTVTVHSEPGRGATFRIYLPRRSSDAGRSAQAADTAPAGGCETILLVDDEPALLEMAAEMLTGLGYAVVSQSSGTEALDCFTSDPAAFDLVITDHTMPGMTGIALTERIRAMGCPTPVILCSGLSADIAVQRAYAAGIQAVLKKPILQRELAATIRRVLDKP